MTYTPTTDKVRVAYIVGNIYSAKDCGTPPQTPTQLKREFDRWYAEEIRKAKHDAWQEGYADCMDYHMSNGLKGAEANPYKEEA